MYKSIETPPIVLTEVVPPLKIGDTFIYMADHHMVINRLWGPAVGMTVERDDRILQVITEHKDGALECVCIKGASNG